MGRRDTAYFAGKTSVFITNETRGVPYKWVSLAIAATYVFFGLRNIFFCGYKLPVGAGEALVMEMWQDCKEDKVKTIFEGMHGLGDWLVGKIIYPLSYYAVSRMRVCLISSSYILLAKKPLFVSPWH